jgi:hypothetical protein
LELTAAKKSNRELPLEDPLKYIPIKKKNITPYFENS